MIKQQRTKKSKFLIIKIDKVILESVNEFCIESGIEPKDLGFREGFICASGGDQIIEVLASVSQIYFFSGMLYAHKNKNNDKVTFSYTDKKGMEAIKSAASDKSTKQSYVG